MLWVILFVGVLLLLYIKCRKTHQYWKDRNVSYLEPQPIIGNMARILFRFTSFTEGFDEWYKEKSNERYFGVYQFLKPYLILRDLDLIKQVAVKDFESFLDHQSLVSEEIDPLFGKNLFSLKGQKWRHMRSTLSPSFTSSKMKAMFVLLTECADEFTDCIMKTSENKENIVLEMKDLFTRFGSDVVGTCAFGIKTDSLGEPNNEFYTMGRKATDFSGIRGLKFFGFSISPFLMKLLKVRLFELDVSDFFRTLVKTTIETREKLGIVRPDMINLLMEARKGKLSYEETEKSKDEAGFATVEESDVGKSVNVRYENLTMDDITAQALIFFFGGFDTSSTLMSHVAYELALNPDIHDKLQNEVDDAFINCKGKINYDALAKMKYMDMVISETLRKWPPSMMTDRECNKPFTIHPTEPNESAFEVNRGDILWIPIFSLHRDAKYFPNPDKFDPERFNDKNKGNIKPMSYLPFGLGPRNCIGSRFALLEVKTIIAYILYKFNIVVDKKTQIPLKLKRSDFNLIAENGFWLAFQPRHKNK